MFELKSVPSVNHTDPWHQKFGERFAALSRGKRRIAYFYELADNSTFRYRVYNPVQVLNAKSDEVSASYFFLADSEHFERIARTADMLVVCRTRYSLGLNSIVTHFRNKGKRVVYDVDDLVFDTAYAHLVAATIEKDIWSDSGLSEWYSYVGRIGAAARLCDGAITTNSYLAARLENFLGKPARVMPNFINEEQLTMSEWIYRDKSRTGFKGDGRVHLGYFSGSPTHQRDFGIAASAVESVMKRNELVWLCVAGFMSVEHFAPSIRHRVKHLPFSDFVNLQRLIGAVDINLVPLQNNAFTNCKSELKYFEAAIVGTPSIASPTHTFANNIRHGDNGFLAKAHEWEFVIERVIANRDDYARMASAAHAHSRENYAWSGRLDEVVAALNWD